MQPLTYQEIGEFLQTVIYAFDEYIIFAFVLMCAFTIAMSVRRLLIWGS
jgi:hypothetical protein